VSTESNLKILASFLKRNNLSEEAEEVESLEEQSVCGDVDNDGDSDYSCIDLSEFEESQLGTHREGAKYPFLKSKEDYLKLRDAITNRKSRSRTYKATDEFGPFRPDLSAYTPGETVGLLNHPEIKEWHSKMAAYKIPEEYKTIIFVPCAASKPWGPTSCSGHYYPAYNKVRKDIEEGRLYGSVFFVTISEPLGVVPQDMWDSFPAYDNPGLFGNDPQRTGMIKADWDKSEFGQRYMVPFDPAAKAQAIKSLGDVIAGFVQNNQIEGREWISFVESKDMKSTTHSLMLDSAGESLGGDIVEVKGRFGKTNPDKRPGWKNTYEHMKGVLGNRQKGL
jgi:hypothetical protein|tara:strand:- start:7502 stop:8506 length:1005 start_codon:yes stop_codon:yes gene_type:complete